MDTKKRSWTKSIVWRVIGIVLLSVISYLITGDWKEMTSIYRLVSWHSGDHVLLSREVVGAYFLGLPQWHLLGIGIEHDADSSLVRRRNLIQVVR